MNIRVRIRGTARYVLIDTDNIASHLSCSFNDGTVIVFKNEQKAIVIGDSPELFARRLAEVTANCVELPL
jgi:hypothetical protein